MFKRNKCVNKHYLVLYVKNIHKQSNIKQIAQQRINILFEQADTIAKTCPMLAAQYIKTAQKIAMSARFPIPSKYKRRICKHCKTLLIHGFNCQVRIQQRREPHIVVTCLNCKHISRIPIKKKKEHTKNEQTLNVPHETPR
jgi:ribonuclease P protein subunit RPR2